MNKQLVLTVLFLILILFANGQNLGIKIGANYAKGKIEPNRSVSPPKNLGGVQVGVFYDYPLSKEWSFVPGLFFSKKGVKLEISHDFISVPINYLDFPVSMEFKHYFNKTNLFVNAGPYLGIGLSARAKGRNDTEDIDFGSNKGQIKKADLGLNFGMGLGFDQIKLGINYGLGMVNLENSDDDVYKNRVLTISLSTLLGKP